MENLIKIAADNVQTLRKSDVFRVLEQNDSDVRSELAAYISTNRPDLAEEVEDCMSEF